MNGADSLCDTLLANDVDVCFANPGTSEMHFVAALDRKPKMRCVLGLFEGVVTGAADGYAPSFRSFDTVATELRSSLKVRQVLTGVPHFRFMLIATPASQPAMLPPTPHADITARIIAEKA